MFASRRAIAKACVAQFTKAAVACGNAAAGPVKIGFNAEPSRLRCVEDGFEVTLLFWDAIIYTVLNISELRLYQYISFTHSSGTPFRLKQFGICQRASIPESFSLYGYLERLVVRNSGIAAQGEDESLATLNGCVTPDLHRLCTLGKGLRQARPAPDNFIFEPPDDNPIEVLRLAGILLSSLRESVFSLRLVGLFVKSQSATAEPTEHW